MQSYITSLAFPGVVNEVRPAEDQSPFTRTFCCCGSYNGNLPGAFVYFPLQSPGASILLVRKLIDVIQLQDALKLVDPSFGDGLPPIVFTLVQGYVNVIRDSSSSQGNFETLWSSDAWDINDGNSQLKTLSSRCNSVKASIVRNTVSTSSVAISGTCHATRLDAFQFEGGVEFSQQFCKAFASPDKDYVVSVAQQSGVTSISGSDVASKFVSPNPWSTQGSDELIWSTSVSLTIGGVLWNSLAFIEELDFNGTNIYVYTQDTTHVTEGQDMFGQALLSQMTRLFLSPIVRDTTQNESTQVVRCPSANPFDTPSVICKWTVTTTTRFLLMNWKIIHVYASHDESQVNSTLIETVVVLKTERIASNNQHQPQQFQTTIERPDTTGKPRGMWIGVLVSVFCSFPWTNDFTAFLITEAALSYRYKISNPAHVMSWDATNSSTSQTPIVCNSSSFSEVMYNNEARPFASVSNYRRCTNYNSLIEARNKFVFDQVLKTSHDSTTYGEREKQMRNEVGNFH